MKANGSDSAAGYEWRGERRSARLGPEGANDIPHNRSMTEDSESSIGDEFLITRSSLNGPAKASAAAVKPTEVAVESLGHKKKNKVGEIPSAIR